MITPTLCQTIWLLLLLIVTYIYLFDQKEGYWNSPYDDWIDGLGEINPYTLYGQRRGSSYDLRGDVPIPVHNVGPWLNSSYAPLRNKPLFMVS